MLRGKGKAAKEMFSTSSKEKGLYSDINECEIATINSCEQFYCSVKCNS